MNPGQGPAWKAWLLVRRSLTEPHQRSAFRALAPADTPLEKLVEVAGRRWEIECSLECSLEQAKGEVGLDPYEVRSWAGGHRHVMLSMLALAFLCAVRASGSKGGRLFPGKRAGSRDGFEQARGLGPRDWPLR